MKVNLAWDKRKGLNKTEGEDSGKEKGEGGEEGKDDGDKDGPEL